jgi:hypothetical protein
LPSIINRNEAKPKKTIKYNVMDKFTLNKRLTIKTVTNISDIKVSKARTPLENVIDKDIFLKMFSEVLKKKKL